MLIEQGTSADHGTAAQIAGDMLREPPREAPAAGSHLARWLRAERKGIISRDELTAAMAPLEVIAEHVLIPAAMGGRDA